MYPPCHTAKLEFVPSSTQICEFTLHSQKTAIAEPGIKTKDGRKMAVETTEDKKKRLADKFMQACIDDEKKYKGNMKQPLKRKKKRKHGRPTTSIELHRPSIWIANGHTYTVDINGRDKDGKLIYKDTRILKNDDGEVVNETPSPITGLTAKETLLVYEHRKLEEAKRA